MSLAPWAFAGCLWLTLAQGDKKNEARSDGMAPRREEIQDGVSLPSRGGVTNSNRYGDLAAEPFRAPVKTCLTTQLAAKNLRDDACTEPLTGRSRHGRAA
jgi:hypothetical protein